MRFLYSKNAGNPNITLENEDYKYIFKARRSDKNDIIFMRNMLDSNIYEYKVSNINKHSALLYLYKTTSTKPQISNGILGWCLVDEKIIEKTLPFLNELNIEKITFIKSDYSQGNTRLNIERLNKILIASCCQCGRDNFMKLETMGSIDEFLKENPDTTIFDVSDTLFNGKKTQSILIGPEGGFSDKERDIFNKSNVYSAGNLILRSETACIYGSILAF